MEAVDRNVQRSPVRIGIGTPAQKDALYQAGAEKVWTHDEIDELLVDGLRQAVFRQGDVVIMVQANLLHIKPMSLIAGEGVTFEIPGHDPRTLPSDEAIREFRKLEPIGVVVERSEKRGAKPVWPVLTEAQVQTIVSLWRTPSMKRALVVDRVREIVGAEVPAHWVRDQVIKATGSAKRSLSDKESSE